MLNINNLFEMKNAGEKITMLTCYDYSFAKLLENCKIDIILVGDTLGMTICGHSSTLPVTLDEMVYHTKNVSRGAKNTLLMADLPFASYQESPQQAFASAAKLIQAGAHIIKLEGGEYLSDTTLFLQERGIPVCSHIGLTPQYVNKIGGYLIQGKNLSSQNQIIKDAKAHENAGATMILIECTPTELAKNITEKLKIPVIGIGAGNQTDGQVLVLQDMLNITLGKKPKFVKNFMQNANDIGEAIKKYIQQVKDIKFPNEEHSYN